MKFTFTLFIFVLSLMTGCTDRTAPSEILEYEGPFQEAEDLILYYSESASVQVRLTTAKLWEYENGDREFPEGIFMEFFGESGDITSTLKANEAFFDKKENRWRGRGDVEIRNMENNQQLDTEELFWKPDEGVMYTNKFVTINDNGEIMKCNSLRAAQDFSWYGCQKPEGDIRIQE
jgi:LPS export ABC transporter protein LptC